MFEQLLNNVNSALNESKKPVKEEMGREVFDSIEDLLDQEDVVDARRAVGDIVETLYIEGNFDEDVVVEYLTNIVSSEVTARYDNLRDTLDSNESKKPAKVDNKKTSNRRWTGKPSRVGEARKRGVKMTKEAVVKGATFADVQKASADGEEGIVCLGAGGDPNEWVNGIVGIWNDEGIFTGTPEEAFSAIYTLTSTGGRIDLVMIFNSKAKLNIGKMAMWRLQFGDCSWVSDFVVNYASQYGAEPPHSDYNEEDDMYESKKKPAKSAKTNERVSLKKKSK